jgi:hypothetical protein
MKFNCGSKSFWLPILLPIVAILIAMPFLTGRSTNAPEPEPVKKAPAPAPIPPPPPPAPPAPPASRSSDPVLRQWQDAIRTRNAGGVLNAQTLFLSREGEYREPLRTMAAEDSEPRIRAFSVAVLGRMKSPPPESFFLQRLDDASEYPRTSSLQALEKIGTAACLAKVDGLAASDPAPAVRAAAAQTAKAVRSR